MAPSCFLPFPKKKIFKKGKGKGVRIGGWREGLMKALLHVKPCYDLDGRLRKGPRRAPRDPGGVF